LAEIGEPVVFNQTEAKLVKPASASEQVAWKIVIAGEIDCALESDIKGLKTDLVAEGVETSSERAEPFVETLLNVESQNLTDFAGEETDTRARINASESFVENLSVLQRDRDQETIGVIRVMMRVFKREIERGWHNGLGCKSECSEPGERRRIGRRNEGEEESIQAGRSHSGDDCARISAVSYKTVAIERDILASELRAMFFDPAERWCQVARVEGRNEDTLLPLIRG
jgi:hypothetical protein